MARIYTKIGVEFNNFGAFCLAFFFYFFAIFLLAFHGYTIKQNALEKSIRYTNQKDAFIDIYVFESEPADTITAPKKAEKIVKNTQINKQTTPKEEIKTTNKQTATKDEIAASSDNSLSDLFKNLKFENSTKAVQSNKKSATQNAQTSASDIVKSLNTDSSRRAPKSGARGVYDKFLGDVTQIIEEKWSIYKADTNNDAKIQIFIDKFGKLSYNILSLSPNSEFNDKVRDFLWQLKDEKFPTPPDNQTAQITLNLIDKIETEL